jgi:hypothetical protein
MISRYAISSLKELTQRDSKFELKEYLVSNCQLARELLKTENAGFMSVDVVMTILWWERKKKKKKKKKGMGPHKPFPQKVAGRFRWGILTIGGSLRNKGKRLRKHNLRF